MLERSFDLMLRLVADKNWYAYDRVWSLFEVRRHCSGHGCSKAKAHINTASEAACDSARSLATAMHVRTVSIISLRFRSSSGRSAFSSRAGREELGGSKAKLSADLPARVPDLGTAQQGFVDHTRRAREAATTTCG